MVTVAVANYGPFGRLVETLPGGFTYVSSNLSDEQVQHTGQEYRFTLQGEPSVTYTVTASSTAGPHPFSGALSDSNLVAATVGGASSVTVSARCDGGDPAYASSDPTAPGSRVAGP